jgi:hypothetical protein
MPVLSAKVSIDIKAADSGGRYVVNFPTTGARLAIFGPADDTPVTIKSVVTILDGSGVASSDGLLALVFSLAEQS